MTNILPPAEESEIRELASQLGAPNRYRHFLSLEQSLWGKAEWQLQDNRRAEVVFIFPRPNHEIILHIKQFYPRGCYRLPSGGVDIDEPLLDAIHREAEEETGQKIKPIQMLAVAEYFTEIDWHFASYLILFEQTNIPLFPIDTKERIEDFKPFPVSDLQTAAERLNSLSGEWSTWGTFRAIIHRIAYQEIINRNLFV